MPNLPLLFSLSWIARVVFLARTLLCVRAEKEKNMFFSIFPFFAGKRYAETKKTRVRSGRERKKKHDFPVFRREKVCRKKKCQHMRSGRERKQDFFRFYPFFAEKRSVEKNASTCVRAEKAFIFSIFPVFREETARRKKMPTRAFG